MAYVKYREGCGSSFRELVQTLGSATPENLLNIDPSSGAGYIRYIDIEPGLQLRLWNCSFNEGLTIFRSASSEDPRSFTLVSYLTSSSVQMKDCHNAPAVVNNAWDSALMSSEANFQTTLLPGKTVKCISINFSTAWLQKNVLCAGYLHTNLIRRLSVTTDPFLIFESLSVLEREQANSLFNEDNPAIFGKFFWRSKVLNVLTLFFSKIINRLSVCHGTDNDHEAQMAEVEKHLLDNLYNGLPDLKTLARKLAISESTLKRYFRRIYGKNIYHYYLEKRMSCAKRLIVEKNKTVSEAANIMGYENISHFSTTFKKHFGSLPGTMRKKSTSRSGSLLEKE
jgi:AraC-like DNA-binding protein